MPKSIEHRTSYYTFQKKLIAHLAAIVFVGVSLNACNESSTGPDDNLLNDAKSIAGRYAFNLIGVKSIHKDIITPDGAQRQPIYVSLDLTQASDVSTVLRRYDHRSVITWRSPLEQAIVIPRSGKASYATGNYVEADNLLLERLPNPNGPGIRTVSFYPRSNYPSNTKVEVVVDEEVMMYNNGHEYTLSMHEPCGVIENVKNK